MIRDGARMEAAMTYAAVVGRPMPRMTQVMAVNTRDGNSMECASWIIMSPKITPIPVRETMPTTMPAQAQPMTMDMAENPDFTIAEGMSLKVKRFFLSNSMMMGTEQVAHSAEYSGESWITRRAVIRMPRIRR